MNIIPLPEKVTVGSGNLFLGDTLTVFVNEKFSFVKSQIKARLSDKKVTFSDDEDDAQLSFLYKDGIKNEGYLLSVNEKATVCASDVSGAYYGFMTFLQIREGDAIPRCEIEDKPRFSYRSIMVDVARHFFGKEEIKQLLDNMAYYKMNFFHFHLTEDQGWRIEIKKYPELAEKGSIRKNDWKNHLGQMTGKEYGRGLYFTQEDIKELVEYAKERMIEIVPEIDMPGHITSALSVFPELSCEGKPLEVSEKYGIKSSIGCVGNEKYIAFMRDIIDEVCELFPAPYFHIGGDEVPKDKWKVCPKCQKLMKEKGIKNENDLQGYFTNEMMAYLAEKGKRTIGWNEILENDNLRSDAIAQWWKGKKPQKWIDGGGKIIMSQCVVCYLDYPYILTNLEKIYSLGPDRKNMTEKEQECVLGIEAPLWTEFVYDKKKYDFMLYPRMQAVAEAGWTASRLKNYKDFERRLQKFLPEMEKQGINFCPPRKYNPVGLRGLRQKLIVTRKMVRDPNIEVNY